MYYSAIGMIAAMILVIENLDIILNRNKSFSLPSWRAYRKLLYAIFFYYACDICWGFVEKLKIATLLFADTSVYFISMALGLLCLTQYVVTYLEEDNAFSRFILYSGRVFLVVVATLVVVNIFHPILFTVDSKCVYRALGARYILLTSQILLLILMSVYSLTYIMRKNTPAEKRMRYRTLAAFSFIMALFLIAQIWYPYYPLYAVAYLMGTCLLRAVVISDEKEELRHELAETSRIAELKQTISAIFDNMPALSFSKDAKTGVYLACNQAFAEYAGKKSPAGVVGLTDEQIFDSDTASHFVEDDHLALSMEEPYIFYEDVPDASGGRKQFQTTKLRYTDDTGRICLLGMCQDVTDMVRIQREHASTKDEYEKARSTGIIFNHMAHALARSYIALFYVNLETEEFLEFRTEGNGRLAEVRHDWNFFENCRNLAIEYVHPDDLALFQGFMNRDNIIKALGADNTYMMTYRRMPGQGGPQDVSMKISRMEEDENFIIIGLTDIDDQVRRRRAADRMKEERTAYARISALTGEFICVYIVVPETGRYREYSASAGYMQFALPKEGMDFFEVSREKGRDTVYPEDLDRFLALFTSENVFAEIKNSGLFVLSYRLVIDGKPRYVRLKAAMVEENDGPRLIVGINDVDNQVRQEEAQEKRLAQIRKEAYTDALTGVKNRLAYLDMENRLNTQISDYPELEFAVVVFDVNDLKLINDTKGHQAGDQHLKEAAHVIRETFADSPVFRVGGDEFVVIARGTDYKHLDELVEKVKLHNYSTLRYGGVTIACGMAKFKNDPSVAQVFRRADKNMYDDKASLKLYLRNNQSNS